MLKEFFFVCLLVVYMQALPAPAPQMDPAGAAMMVGLKAMEIVENGAAAGSEHELEFMGAKLGQKTNVGFGEAANRKRRAINTEQMSKKGGGRHRMRRAPDSNSSSSSSSSSSDDSDEK